MTDVARDRGFPAWLPGVAHTALRVVTGLLFMEHGVQKLFGLLLDPSQPWHGPPAMFSKFWVAGVLETFGGLLIVLGLLPPPVAVLLHLPLPLLQRRRTLQPRCRSSPAETGCRVQRPARLVRSS